MEELARHKNAIPRSTDVENREVHELDSLKQLAGSNKEKRDTCVLRFRESKEFCEPASDDEYPTSVQSLFTLLGTDLSPLV
jgi:hypothetical protein